MARPLRAQGPTGVTHPKRVCALQVHPQTSRKWLLLASSRRRSRSNGGSSRIRRLGKEDGGGGRTWRRPLSWRIYLILTIGAARLGWAVTSCDLLIHICICRSSATDDYTYIKCMYVDYLHIYSVEKKGFGYHPPKVASRGSIPDFLQPQEPSSVLTGKLSTNLKDERHGERLCHPVVNTTPSTPVLEAERPKSREASQSVHASTHWGMWFPNSTIGLLTQRTREITGRTLLQPPQDAVLPSNGTYAAAVHPQMQLACKAQSWEPPREPVFSACLVNVSPCVIYRPVFRKRGP